MVMRVRPTRKERLVKLLRDPEPKFISIVDHGANETPWAVVKRAQLGVKRMAVRRRIKPVSKNATKQSGVRSLVFDKEVFENESAVKSWLDENDWEGYELTTKGDTFVASDPKVSDKDFENLRAVKVDDGIDAQVGELAPKQDKEEEGEEKEGEEEELEATEHGNDRRKRPPKTSKKEDEEEEVSSLQLSVGDSELAKKFDPWFAAFSSGRDLGEVIKDGMKDGLPPGMHEIFLATQAAVANTFKSKDKDKDKELDIKKIAADFAEISIGVYKLFKTLTETEDDSEDSKKFCTTMTEFLDSNADKTTKTKDSNSDSLQTSANNIAGIAAAVATSIAAAMEPINKTLVDLATQVKETKDIAEKAAETVETVSKSVNQTEERIKDLEETTPTQKSDDSEGSTNGAISVSDDDEEYLERIQRDAFGL